MKFLCAAFTAVMSLITYANAATINVDLTGPTTLRLGEIGNFEVVFTPDWTFSGLLNPRLTEDFVRVDFSDGSASATLGATTERIELESFRARNGTLSNPDYYAWLFAPFPVPEQKTNTFSQVFSEAGLWTVQLTGSVYYWRGVLREPNCCNGLTGGQAVNYDVSVQVLVTDPSPVPLPAGFTLLALGCLAFGSVHFCGKSKNSQTV